MVNSNPIFYRLLGLSAKVYPNKMQKFEHFSFRENFSTRK